jgi:sensor domain CHASE-containing protein
VKEEERLAQEKIQQEINDEVNALREQLRQVS